MILVEPKAVARRVDRSIVLERLAHLKARYPRLCDAQLPKLSMRRGSQCAACKPQLAT
jgi:hypothetical protein